MKFPRLLINVAEITKISKNTLIRGVRIRKEKTDKARKIDTL